MPTNMALLNQVQDSYNRMKVKGFERCVIRRTLPGLALTIGTANAILNENYIDSER
jgi:hypothetical protein